MEKPYRYRKRLVQTGGSHYVLLPANWVKKKVDLRSREVIVEVYPDEIKVFPVE